AHIDFISRNGREWKASRLHSLLSICKGPVGLLDPANTTHLTHSSDDIEFLMKGSLPGSDSQGTLDSDVSANDDALALLKQMASGDESLMTKFSEWEDVLLTEGPCSRDLKDLEYRLGQVTEPEEMATPEGLVRLIELLAEALKKLPDLTQGLRAGSTTHLEIRLSQAAPAAAEEILKCNENDQATFLATFYAPLQAAILEVAPDLKARLKVCLATLSVIQEKTLSMQKLINLLTAIDG
ncbi:unnamed protein product, partial [Prorocentrum cordatum]